MSELTQRSVEQMIAEAVEAAEDRRPLIRTVQRYLRAATPRKGGEQALGVPRSTRWEMVGRSQADGSLDLARLEVQTGTETKPLLACMYADLADASDNHRRFAMANEMYAEQYRKLSEMLLADDNARTVRDLPEQQVRRILSA